MAIDVTKPARKAAKDMMDYIWASPSPRHCVKESVARLEDAGFSEDDDVRGYSTKGGSLLAWRQEDTDKPLRIIIAHTDSPNLRIKPNPDYTSAATQVLGVETYGGLLKNSWLDRELSVAGHVIIDNDGELAERLIRFDEPLMRVAQLAIHLDQDRSKGLSLNEQNHLRPIWATGDDVSFMEYVAKEIGVEREQILSHSLMTYDVNKPAFFGHNKEFIASARIDNQLSCWAAIEALCDAETTGTAVVALFDHEEVGSISQTGAGSSLLADLLDSLDVYGHSDALIISADCAHATHPNYADLHEANHTIEMNKGPVIKINANERYATTPLGSALFIQACERRDIDHQVFVTRTDLRCGSTVGPVTAARTSMETIDLGAAQLSMHSAREMTGTNDPFFLKESLTSVLEG